MKPGCHAAIQPSPLTNQHNLPRIAYRQSRTRASLIDIPWIIVSVPARGWQESEERQQMLQVKECMMLTLEFQVRTTGPDGQSGESSTQTCSFVYGVDVQYPSVEKALRDKKAGDRVQVTVPPEELFGAYDEDLVRELPSCDYRQERLKAGKMYREMRKKCLVQFLVKELREDFVVADFNDPKAGTVAEFDILIKDIREATKSEMKPSCARG
jgi:FKBP-type peptidyl-prolyl cis-trans isomerase SlyD